MLNNLSKEVLICSLALLTFGSLSTTDVNAKRIHHHAHYHTVKVIRHHIRRYHGHHKRYNHYNRRYINHIYHTYINRCYDSKHISNHLRKQLIQILPKLSFEPLNSLDDSTNDRIHDTIHSEFIYRADSMTSKLQRKAMNRQERQIAHYDFKDINKERIQHHKQPVAWNPDIQKIADVRIGQVYNAFKDNKDPHGYNLNYSKMPIVKDIKKLHLQNKYELLSSVNENLNNLSYGSHVPVNADSKGKTSYYSAHNPKQLAHAMNNQYMYHDQGANNGHRHDILNDNWSYVGIASRKVGNNIDTIEVYGE